MKLLIKIYIFTLSACLAFTIVSNSRAEEEPLSNIVTPNKDRLYFLRNSNIWTFDFKSGQKQQITHDKKITSYCASADGNLLAYFVDAK